MTVQIRTNTAAAWTSSNPVLADGEPGYEKDTMRLKVGDGTKAWTALPYGWIVKELADTASSESVYNVSSSSKTASYVLALADRGTVVEMNVAGANTLTVPASATVAFSPGDTLEVFQRGAGQTTITPASGVTLLSPSGHLKIAAQYSTAGLRYLGSDVWAVEGNLSA